MAIRKIVASPYFAARQPIGAFTMGITAPAVLAWTSAIPGTGASLAALLIRISTASTGGTPPHNYTFHLQAAVSNRVYSEPLTIIGNVLHTTGEADGNGQQVAADDILDTMEFNITALTGAPAAGATGVVGTLWYL